MPPAAGAALISSPAARWEPGVTFRRSAGHAEAFRGKGTGPSLRHFTGTLKTAVTYLPPGFKQVGHGVYI